MKRTDILCPNCMRKNLLTNADETDTYCDECGTRFVKTGERSVRYA